MTHWTVDTKQITDYLAAMVRIDSVNPDLVPGGAGEAAMADWLVAACQELGLEVSTQETAPGRPNVIARWRGTGGGKSLLLTGHTDIVSVENMTIEPFTPTIQDGRMYGRGSLDMKGGLAAILGAVAALQAADFQPAGDIILGFVTDEEYASIGTEALVKAVKADGAILTEPTNLQVCTAHRGFAWLTITTEGRAAHGSLYRDGIDAILQMRHVLNALAEIEDDILPQRTHALLGRPSTHVSFIEGGLGLSIFPDRCTIQVEHRPLPGENAADVLAMWQDKLRELEAMVPDFKASVQLDFERPGLEVDHDAPIVKTLQAAFRQVMAQEPTYYGMLAWLDAALLAAADIPTVVIGPGGEGLHAAVEYVNLEDVYRCAEILAEATAQWSG